MRMLERRSGEEAFQRMLRHIVGTAVLERDSGGKSREISTKTFLKNVAAQVSQGLKKVCLPACLPACLGGGRGCQGGA